MQVLELHGEDKPAWDDYVWRSPQAVPYHLIGWKEVMERTYGYPSHYLMAKDGGRIEGVMPLFEIKSRIVGDSLATLPGGLCAESEEAAVALVERAKEITVNIDAKYLAIRDSRREWDAGLVSVSRHCTMMRDLPLQTDALWKSLNKKLRRHIRIARKSDLQVSIGGKEYLDDFYTVLCAFLRGVGTPVFSRTFLHNVAKELGDHLLILSVRWEGQLIGAYAAFLFQDTIFGAWGGSLYRYLDRRPNHMLYWQYMQYGCEHGFKHIDLGRSLQGSGQYKFKKGWGSQSQPLYQQYFLNGLEMAPDVSSRMEADYRYRLFIWLWQKLPLPVTQWVGPKIRRHVPFG
jgi:FemAB-related protein (PEP-CTERM system-associated)